MDWIWKLYHPQIVSLSLVNTIISLFSLLTWIFAWKETVSESSWYKGTFEDSKFLGLEHFLNFFSPTDTYKSKNFALVWFCSFLWTLFFYKATENVLTVTVKKYMNCWKLIGGPTKLTCIILGLPLIAEIALCPE